MCFSTKFETFILLDQVRNAHTFRPSPKRSYFSPKIEKCTKRSGSAEFSLQTFKATVKAWADTQRRCRRPSPPFCKIYCVPRIFAEIPDTTGPGPVRRQRRDGLHRRRRTEGPDQELLQGERGAQFAQAHRKGEACFWSRHRVARTRQVRAALLERLAPKVRFCHKRVNFVDARWKKCLRQRSRDTQCCETGDLMTSQKTKETRIHAVGLSVLSFVSHASNFGFTFSCSGHAVLLSPWQPYFRIATQNIGRFFRSQLPPSVVVFVTNRSTARRRSRSSAKRRIRRSASSSPKTISKTSSASPCSPQTDYTTPRRPGWSWAWPGRPWVRRRVWLTKHRTQAVVRFQGLGEKMRC